ncbi:MAG: hypothetical protein ACR2KG_08695 [Nocardioidaceae bacterium]
MPWTQTRSRIANAKRLDPTADVTELQRQLRAERLEDHVRRIVDGAPPLTADQRDRIALVLRGGGGPHA